MNSFRFSTVLLCLTAFAGCGDGKVHVTGTVSLDGQSVANGSIAFVSETAREGAVIQDGKFAAALPPGKYKLELNGSKTLGKRTQKGFNGKDEVVEETGELFPEKFNAKSELSEEIKSGMPPLKLDLKSK